MADTDSHTQRVIPEITQNPPSKSYFNFIYKAILVSIVLIVLPLFPSQAPEFVNQTIPDRSWELVHLLFVGIAVSYGLFSRRNVEVEKEKENHLKNENAHTYMSRILQVSSVFDDETEMLSGSDENLVQTWNSKYYRGQSTVLVAEQNSVFDGNCNNVSVKPLVLPIRSLRSQISEPGFDESGRELERSVEASDLMRRSYSSSTDRNVNGENGDFSCTDLGEEFKGNFVLPSPIPWRSRSGRMIMKEQVNSFPPSVEEFDFNGLNSQSLSSVDYMPFQPFSTSHSPKLPSFSPSISPEFHSENFQEMEMENISRSSSAPPSQSISDTHIHHSSLITSNSSPIIDGFTEQKKIRRRSKDQKDLSRRSREDLGLNLLKSEAKFSDQSSVNPLNSSPTREGFSEENDTERSFKDQKDSSRSSRTEDLGLSFSQPEAKCSDERSLVTFNSSPTRDRFLVDKNAKRSINDQKDLSRRSREDPGQKYSKTEAKRRTRTEGSSKGKSVRTIRGSEPVAETMKAREVGGYQLDEKIGKRSKEVEAVKMEKTRKRAEGFDSLLLGSGKSSYESSQHASTSNYQKKHKKKLAEKVILETEEYSDSEVDEIQETLATKETDFDDVSSVKSDSHEVDKKADEFIAKFREQIRLQRVESSKRSNGKHSSRNLSR